MARRISATHVAKKLREVLNEVELNGETFEVERHGKLVAEIRPPGKGPARSTWGNLLQVLEKFPPDPDFARDIEDARRALLPPEDKWERWSKPQSS